MNAKPQRAEDVLRLARGVRVTINVDDPPGRVLYLGVRDDFVGGLPSAVADPRRFDVIGMRERAGHFGGG